MLMVAGVATLAVLAGSMVAAQQAGAAEPARITGRVVSSSDGSPVAGCEVAAHNDPINPGQFQPLFFVDTEADGSFDIPTFYEGDFVLEFACAGFFYEVYDGEVLWKDGTRLVTVLGAVTAIGTVALEPAPDLAVSLLDVPWDSWRVRRVLHETPQAGFFFGDPGDEPFVGDWDCDGSDTPGLYRSSDGFVYLRNSLTEGIADRSFFFGNPGDIPVAGDFDGDGCDTVSLYRPDEGRFFVINELGPDGGSLGPADYSFYFGNPGDKPFAGDLDGDGVDELGLHRESTGLVYYRLTLTQGIADRSFVYGDPGDQIVAGDWLGTGTDTVGLYRPSDDAMYLRFANSAGSADYVWHLTPGYAVENAAPRRGVFPIPRQPAP